MKINIENKNIGFVKILNNNFEDFLIDANIFIPPDRSQENRQIKPIAFTYYKENWLIPFIEAFKPVGIHEAVYGEFQSNNVKSFVDEQMQLNPPKARIYIDDALTEEEKILRTTIESSIAKNTNYNPKLDNSDDKGEVKSLAYIATKELLYFCSRDANAIRLIEDAPILNTCLENVSAIQPYEIMYYFWKNNMSNSKSIKLFYKYMYRLTEKEKKYNPEWNGFIEKMDILYLNDIKHI